MSTRDAEANSLPADDPHRLIEAALAGLAGNIGEVADEVGVSYASLYAWATGRRRPTSGSLAKLAEVVDRRARHLRQLANDLRAEVDAQASE